VTTQTATICEECGLEKNRWKSNNGKGFERHGEAFCCQGCFLGIGCTCVETGVRRVVVVGGSAPAPVTKAKVGRQVRAWGSKIASLENQARNRQAAPPAAVRQELEKAKEGARAAAGKARVKRP
jgi:hypothetical protein